MVQGAFRAGIGLRQALQKRGDTLRSERIAPRLLGLHRLLDAFFAAAFIGG